MDNSLGLSVDGPQNDWSASTPNEQLAASPPTADWSIPTSTNAGTDDWSAPAGDLISPTSPTSPQHSAQSKGKRSAGTNNGAPPDDSVDTPQAERKTPYVNRDRVKSGGPTREKLSPEELEAKMADIRKRNQQIKEKRELVLADEAAFKQLLVDDAATAKARAERTRNIQDKVNRDRNQNAQRKLDKMSGREWDSAKGSNTAVARNSHDGPSSAEGNWKLARQQQEGRQDKPYKSKRTPKPPRPKEAGAPSASNNTTPAVNPDASEERSDSSADDNDPHGKARGAAARNRRGTNRGGTKARARRTASSSDEHESKTANDLKPLQGAYLLLDQQQVSC
ncbi:hypothetical protein BKA62DRAFT_42176 [Auriculariales sp. MPI-PUGE-AT-0066]|nr:hypothetical protein BKA62DRAFT_101956 [Auriculariales sp. MPI-PUGE-AT-0066]KAH7096125.1 hypothetical protein BKA62DRAFT_42176 [Auriculariales sp. MPI-PUGE-AT-0066]